MAEVRAMRMAILCGAHRFLHCLFVNREYLKARESWWGHLSASGQNKAMTRISFLHDAAVEPVRSYRSEMWRDLRARSAADPNGFHPLRTLRGAIRALRAKQPR